MRNKKALIVIASAAIFSFASFSFISKIVSENSDKEKTVETPKDNTLKCNSNNSKFALESKEKNPPDEMSAILSQTEKQEENSCLFIGCSMFFN